MHTTDYDIVIAGGGMTGSLLALALAQISSAVGSYRIALIEAVPLKTFHPAFDGRALALADGTVLSLQQLGVWDVLKNLTHPIRKIHVSEKSHVARVHISSDEYAVDALGHVLELAPAGFAIQAKLAEYQQIDFLCPDKVEDLDLEVDLIRVRLSNQKIISTRLLISAEGITSTLRSKLSLPIEKHDFKQNALITTIYVDKPTCEQAWERFTPHGPIALLPLGTDCYSLVWCHPPELSESLMSLPSEVFLHQLQQSFGFHAGRFVRNMERAVYPLSLQYLPQSVYHRVVLLGNAAHQLHPVAGQGFNLAMRDIMELKNVLVNTDDPGAYPVLCKYRDNRKLDQATTIGYTSALASLFTEQYSSLLLPRQIGLILMNNLPFLKRQFVKQALGHF